MNKPKRIPDIQTQSDAIVGRSNYKLSPSDLTFLWDECKRCFYLKVVRGFNRPATAFPSIFGAIDSQMTSHYNGMRTERISPFLPPGVIRHGQQWVQSQPVAVPGSASTCYIRGRFDTAIAFDDGTYGLIDFKTSSPKPAHVTFYGRQLHAYALALERPAPNSFSLHPVTTLGLMVFEPASYLHDEKGTASFGGSISWVEIPRNDEAFLAFLGQVTAVLDLPEPPEAASTCVWCQYRQASRNTGY